PRSDVDPRSVPRRPARSDVARREGSRDRAPAEADHHRPHHAASAVPAAERRGARSDDRRAPQVTRSHMQSCTLPLLLFVAGCLQPLTGGSAPSAGSGSATTTGAPTATPSDYDLEILDVAAHYKSAAFTKINSAAYASSLTGIGQINVYAYGDAMTYK